MAPNGTDSKLPPMSDAARRREAERAALREVRLAEALRSNLKRRKEQARGRTASEPNPDDPSGPADT